MPAQQVEGVRVGLPFMSTREAVAEQHRRHRHGERRAGHVAEQHPRQHEHRRAFQRLAHPVAMDVVAGLVGEHGQQLFIRFRQLHQGIGHVDPAVGQREGIRPDAGGAHDLQAEVGGARFALDQRLEPPFEQCPPRRRNATVLQVGLVQDHHDLVADMAFDRLRHPLGGLARQPRDAELHEQHRRHDRHHRRGGDRQPAPFQPVGERLDPALAAAEPGLYPRRIRNRDAGAIRQPQDPRRAAQARADRDRLQRPLLRIALAKIEVQHAARHLQPHRAGPAGVAVVPVRGELAQKPKSAPTSSASTSSAPAAPRSPSASATKSSRLPMATKVKFSAR